jgi:hypothetical protein
LLAASRRSFVEFNPPLSVHDSKDLTRLPSRSPVACAPGSPPADFGPGFGSRRIRRKPTPSIRQSATDLSKIAWVADSPTLRASRRKLHAGRRTRQPNHTHRVRSARWVDDSETSRVTRLDFRRRSPPVGFRSSRLPLRCSGRGILKRPARSVNPPGEKKWESVPYPPLAAVFEMVCRRPTPSGPLVGGARGW